MDALRNAHAPEYKAFFQWIILRPERGPQQAPTLMQYFRLLKMLYYQRTRARVDEEEVQDVNTASQPSSTPRSR